VENVAQLFQELISPTADKMIDGYLNGDSSQLDEYQVFVGGTAGSKRDCRNMMSTSDL
jgi:hypothetical protein